MSGAWGTKLNKLFSFFTRRLSVQIVWMAGISFFCCMVLPPILFHIVFVWTPGADARAKVFAILPDPFIVLLILAMNAAIFILIFRRLFRKKAQYLRAIDVFAKRLASGAIGETIEIRGRDELADLCRTMNDMSLHLAALREKERADEQAKTELIQGVSHDLRTPLTVVKGYLQLLSDHQYKNEAEAQHFLQSAVAKSEHLENLIEELLEYTRLMDDGRKLPAMPLDFDRMLEQMLLDYQPIYEQQGLACDFPALPRGCRIAAAPEKLERAIDNLLGNALKYTTPGGTISVRLVRVKGIIRLVISNTSSKISDDALPHLFERFYRLEKSRSPKTGGSGLGLAITRRIIELHGGTIEARYYDSMLHIFIELPALQSLETREKSRQSAVAGMP